MSADQSQSFVGGAAAAPHAPSESLVRLFVRFLRFGMLAWGGPIAQIAMLRKELVEEQRWVSSETFNRVLGVYQALPGPEATELCVYFGMRARGRPGGLLAGLGFVLPGFALMLLLSWLYVSVGLASPLVSAAFAGCQVAVAALIVRAVHRIGAHTLRAGWLWVIAGAAALGQLAAAPLWLLLGGGAAVGALGLRGRSGLAGAAGLLCVALAIASALLSPAAGDVVAGTATAGSPPSPLALLGAGLRAGLLTFGGAYTAIPFVQRDAVERGGWLTEAQFLDGLALGGIVPAPLVIFVTFVGYLGGGVAGAVAITVGMFLPAFAITLLGHEVVERLIERPAVHAALDGIAAVVVGLIAATALTLLPSVLTDPARIGIFALALLAAYRWRASAAVLGIVGGAAGLGLLLLR